MITLFCIRPKGFNVGNDVIYIALQELLRSEFGELVNIINLPATSKYESHAKAGLTARTIYEINQYGHGVIIGGGNLYENGELDVDLNALQTLATPLMFFSVSRGRVYNQTRSLVRRTDTTPDHVLKAVNEKAQISLARDKATTAYLHGLGLDHVVNGACPTIMLESVADRLPVLQESDQVEVLISIRTPELMSIPLTKRAQVRRDIDAMVAGLKERGYSDIRLLCHDHRDIPFAGSFPELDFVYTGDAEVYLALLKHCRLSISYRLHATLPCFAFGTPSIKISYDERALSLMDTIGLDDWNIDMVQSDNVAKEVFERVDTLDRFEMVRTDAMKVQEEYKTKMRENMRRFAGLVHDYRSTLVTE